VYHRDGHYGRYKHFWAEDWSQNEKNVFFLFIKRKNSIHFIQRDEVPEIGFYWSLGGVGRAKQ